MKRSPLILFALVALAGCFREDYSFCPADVPPSEQRVRLHFQMQRSDYPFEEFVQTVHIGLFDAEGSFLREEWIDTERLLDEFTGVDLDLAPGDYRLVFYGNISSATSLPDLATDDDPWLEHGRDVTLSAATYPASIDRIWYGPYGGDYYELTVPENQNVEETIPFTHAFRGVGVDVLGLDAAPRVELSGVPGNQAYFGLTSSATTTLAAEATSTGAEGSWTTAFDAFYFESMAGIEIALLDRASGEELYRTTLSEAVAASGQDPEAIDLLLQIEFLGGGAIQVTVPDWAVETPGSDFS